jgi:lipooligosaccharide transport system permease protein
VIWAGTKSLISAAAILLVAALLGAVASWYALLTLPVVLLMGFCFASMAIMVTAFAKNYDFFLYYSTLVVTPMLLIGGVFFPLERMAPIVQVFSNWLPLTHAVQVVRPLMTGLPVEQPGLHLLVLSAYTVVALLIAIKLVRNRMIA